MSAHLRKISFDNAVKDTFFLNVLDVKELENLRIQYPDFPVYYIDIEFGQYHFDYFKNKKDRRGEVVVLLENLQNHLLLHTKPQFPNKIYRLLSGGVGHNEPIESGLRREVFEETGFQFEQSEFTGLILNKFLFQHESMPFISYLFKINGIDGQPVIQDKSENISGFKWVPKNELKQVYDQLLNLPEDWKDWGLFRAMPHKIFYENSGKK